MQSAATSAPTPAATVLITINSEPTGAAILLGDALLGHAPGPVSLPRSEMRQTLTVQLAGYETEHVEVVPLVDASIGVQLKRANPKTPGHVAVPADLENPY